MFYIPYILLALIGYDFLIHVIEFKGWHWKFIESRSWFSYVYPHLRWKKNLLEPQNPTERENFQILYDWYWVLHWGLALVLLILYLIYR